MHILKSKVDNLVINMCMHENDDNDDGHNCYQQQGIDIDDLKKCVNCMKIGRKEETGIFSNHITHGTVFSSLACLFMMCPQVNY